MKFCRRFRFVDRGVVIHGGSLELSETIRRFQIREGAMVADEGQRHDTTDQDNVSDVVWAFRVHSDAFRIDECASDIHESHA